MRAVRSVLAIYLPVLACWLTLNPGNARAQVEANSAFDRDTHCFRNILHRMQTENDMEVLGKLTDLRTARPSETVLIIFGRLPASQMEKLAKALPNGGLRGFVQAGGALLVVSDRASENLFAQFGVKIDGTLLTNDRADVTYQNNPACPLLMVSGGNGRETGQVFRGLNTLATNLPSFLEFDHRAAPGSFGELAFLPQGTHAQNNDRAVPPRPLFSVGGELGEGRALFFADHSMFINCMIMQEDNDNAELAYHSLEWLADPEGRKRSKFLYLQDGQPNTALDIPLEPLPFQTEDAELAQFADALMLDIQDNDLPNEFLRKNVSRSTLLMCLLLLSSLGVLVYGVYRLGAMRFRPEPGLAPFGLAALRYGPARTPVNDRIADLHQKGNMLDAGRSVARQFFGVVLGSAPPQPDAKHPPVVRPRGGLSKAELRLNRELREIWSLAYGPAPPAMPLYRLVPLLGRLRVLKRALAGWEVQV
jgi:hypothetical protein